MMKQNRRWAAGMLALSLWGSSALAATPPACAIHLRDATPQLGIGFRHVHGGNGQKYLAEFMVAGLALFDYDGDGLTDIYFLNGAPLPGTSAASPPRNALYRNNGDWTFTDVTERAGVGDRGHALGVVVGDYDHDGDPDLFLNNFGPNVCYRNEGDGTFSDVTQQLQLAGGGHFGAGTCFLDIEGDGDLDLYVANYVAFSYARHAQLMPTAFPYPPGPMDFPPLPDTLYRNNGDGSFRDASLDSGIGKIAGPTMGVICGDWDDDGDTDIFACNDAAANFHFVNDGRGHFHESGVLSGLAYNLHGHANGSMGAECGDVDRDGRLDLFMTDYTGEMPVLYRNAGDGFFDDVTSSARLGRAAYTHTKWGSGLVDFDNDGDRDLFIACGHFLDNIREIDDTTDYRVPNILMQNMGDGTFRDVSAVCGDGLAVVDSSRGVGFDDLDNDGRVDGVILNTNSQPTILCNDSPPGRHWLQIGLRGVRSNRDGVGARVRVVAGDLIQVAEVHAGRGYQSHHGARLQFGLGDRARVDRIEVRWVGGGVDVFHDLTADQRLVLVEGSGASGRAAQTTGEQQRQDGR
jgi:enediyne biosynthesis protein E4